MYAVQILSRISPDCNFDYNEDMFLGFPTLFKTINEAIEFVESLKGFNSWEKMSDGVCRANFVKKVRGEDKILSQAFITPVVNRKKALKNNIYALTVYYC